jgi:hypothetical protein
VQPCLPRPAGHGLSLFESACAPRLLPPSQLQLQKDQDALEAQLGFQLFAEGDSKLGWLLNYTTVSRRDAGLVAVRSIVASHARPCSAPPPVLLCSQPSSATQGLLPPHQGPAGQSGANHTPDPGSHMWLLAALQSIKEDKESGQTLSAVDCFFQCQDGSMFKARVPFPPYFYIMVPVGSWPAGQAGGLLPSEKRAPQQQPASSSGSSGGGSGGSSSRGSTSTTGLSVPCRPHSRYMLLRCTCRRRMRRGRWTPG